MTHLELARKQQFHFVITLKVSELIFILYWHENKTFLAFSQNVFEKENIFLDQNIKFLFALSFSFPPVLEISSTSRHGHFSKKQSNLVLQETSTRVLSSYSYGSIACKDCTSREKGRDKIKKITKQSFHFNQILSWGLRNFLLLCACLFVFFFNFHFHLLVHLWLAADSTSSTAKTPWETPYLLFFWPHSNILKKKQTGFHESFYLRPGWVTY